MDQNESKSRMVFGARAARYTTSAIHAERAVLEKVVELARPWPEARALDVATGTGHTALALAPYVAEVVATDITEEMLSEARKLRAERRIANVTFQAASVYQLPFEDDSFDVVTCRRAAHHFADIRRALAEMRRVLKSGGRLVIDDRGVPEDDFVDSTMNQLDVLHDESHFREYRSSEWQRMLADAGFAIESLEEYVRHRPLSSLTTDVAPENVARILEIVASLDESRRLAMNVIERDGEIYTDHWYLTVSAVKTAVQLTI